MYVNCKVSYIKMLIGENLTLTLMLNHFDKRYSKWSQIRQICEEIYAE